MRPNTPWTATSAICESGHVIEPRLSTEDDEKRVPAFCADCGGDVRTRCAVCGHALSVTTDIATLPLHRTWTAREYCEGCGTPHPWVTRRGALAGLIRLVRRDPEMSDDAKLAAVEQLEALIALPPDALGSAREGRLWRGVKEYAGPVWTASGGREILIQVLPTALRALLS
jgi:hypothetical protein